jgi:hypothetical protein
VSEPAWEAVLADLEAYVDDLEAVAADPRLLDRFGDDGVPAYVPPPVLGPVPAHLRERATDVSARMLGVEAALALTLDGIRHELTAAKRFVAPDSTGGAASYYLDTKA